jgi:hypothetical protein
LANWIIDGARDRELKIAALTVASVLKSGSTGQRGASEAGKDKLGKHLV